MALQSDGKILAGGSVGAPGAYNFGAARFSSNGVLDTTYGVRGLASADFGGSDRGGPTAIQPQDGKIVVFGYTYKAPADIFAVARFLSA